MLLSRQLARQGDKYVKITVALSIIKEAYLFVSFILSFPFVVVVTGRRRYYII